MDMLSRLSAPFAGPDASAPSPALLATTVALATAALLVAARAAVAAPRPAVHRSPLKTTVPRTSKEELATLVYQPESFPGARDVDTPYGSIRVYEFGPEDGPKVLFVHGISTSCIVFKPLTDALVARGCRVMIYDLFGRGFSDNVGDLAHDPRLYTTQMLLALASSPLPWTGDGAFRLIGYSLGGAIAVHFANAFPRLVSSLVLLAPAGLLRAKAFGLTARIVFSSGLIPDRLVAILTRRRLQHPIAPPKKQPSTVAGAAASAVQPLAATPGVEIAAAEAADPAAGAPATPLNARVLTYVRWMVAKHEGFVPAFMSCVRYAPLTNQHDSWRGLARREPGTTAIFLGESDELIDPQDTREDGLALVGGEANVVWKVLPGAHDFVMTQAPAIVAELDAFWGMKAPA